MAKASGNPSAYTGAAARVRVVLSIDARASDGDPPPTGAAASDRVARWIIGVLFVLVLAVPRSMRDRWLDFMDEGHVLQLAEMAANGHPLDRDVIFDALPGAFWLLALVFEVFEPKATRPVGGWRCSPRSSSA